MTSEPENIVLEQLRLTRADIARMETKFDAKFDDLSHKVGSLAQTLVAVQRDVKGLRDSVTTLGIATDEHTSRLERIEKRVGIADA
jgi:hypothetical protein